MIINPKIEKQIILNVFNKKKYYFEELFTLTNIAIGSFIAFILFLFFKKNDSIDRPYLENQYSNLNKFNSLENSTEKFQQSIDGDKTLSKDEKKEILEYVNQIKEIDKKLHDFIIQKNEIIELLKSRLTERDNQLKFFLDEFSNGIFDDLKNRFNLLRTNSNRILKTELNKLEIICNKQKELIEQSKDIFAKIVILLKNDNKLFYQMYTQHFGPYSYNNIKQLYNYSVKNDIFYFKISLSNIKNNEFRIDGIFPTTIYNHNLSFKKIDENKYQILYKEKNNKYSKIIKKYEDFLEIINSEKITFDVEKDEKKSQSFKKEENFSSPKKPNFNIPISQETVNKQSPIINTYDKLRNKISELLDEYKKQHKDFLNDSKNFIKQKDEIIKINPEKEDDINKLLKDIQIIENDDFHNKKINDIPDEDLRDFQSQLKGISENLLINLVFIFDYISSLEEFKVQENEKQEEIKKQIESNYSLINQKFETDEFKINSKNNFKEIIDNYSIVYSFFISNIKKEIKNNNNDEVKKLADELIAKIEAQKDLYENTSNYSNYDELLEHLKEDIKNIFEGEEEEDEISINQLLHLIETLNEKESQEEKKKKEKEINEQIQKNVEIFKDIKSVYNINDYDNFYQEILKFLSSKNSDNLIYEYKKTLKQKIEEIKEEYIKIILLSNDDYKSISKHLTKDEKIFRIIIKNIKNQEDNNNKSDTKKTTENNPQVKKENDEQERKQIKKIKAEMNIYIKNNVSIFNSKIKYEDYNILNYKDFGLKLANYLSLNDIDQEIITISNIFIKYSEMLDEASSVKHYQEISNFVYSHEVIFKRIIDIIEKKEKESSEKNIPQNQKEPKEESIPQQQEEPKKVIDDVLDSLKQNQETTRYLKIDDNKYTLSDDDSDYTISFKPFNENFGSFIINSKIKNEDEDKEIDIKKLFIENKIQIKEHFFADGKYEIKNDKIKILEINFKFNVINEIKNKIKDFKINDKFINLIKSEIKRYFDKNNPNPKIKLNPDNKIYYIIKDNKFYFVFEDINGLNKKYYYFKNVKNIVIINDSDLKILEFNNDYKFHLIDIYNDFKINDQEFNFLSINNNDIKKLIEEGKKEEDPLTIEQTKNQNLKYNQNEIGFLKSNVNNRNHPEYLIINNRKDYITLKTNSNIETYFYLKNKNNDNQLLYIKIDENFSDILKNISEGRTKIVHDSTHYDLSNDQRKDSKIIYNFFKHIIKEKKSQLEKTINFNIIKIDSNDSLTRQLQIDNNYYISLESLENKFIKNYFLKKIN